MQYKLNKASLFGVTVLLASLCGKAGAVEMHPVLQDADVVKMVDAAKQAMLARHTTGCIAVADADGEVLFLQRQENAASACLSSVLGKVKTAATFQMPSEMFYDNLTQNKSLMMLTIPGMTALPGGIPLLAGNVVIGAIAISTPDPKIDLQIAKVAAEALK